MPDKIALLANGKRLVGYESGKDGFYYKVQTWNGGGKKTFIRDAGGYIVKRASGDQRPKWMWGRDVLAKLG